MRPQTASKIIVVLCLAALVYVTPVAISHAASSSAPRLYKLIRSPHGAVYAGRIAPLPNGGFVVPVVTAGQLVLVRGTPRGSLRRMRIHAAGLPRRIALDPSATVVTSDGSVWFGVNDERATSTLVRVARSGAVTVKHFAQHDALFYLAPSGGNSVTFLDIFFGAVRQEWIGSADPHRLNPFEQIVNSTGVGMVLSFVQSGGLDWFFSTTDGPGVLHSFDPNNAQLATYNIGVEQKLSGLEVGAADTLWILAQDESSGQILHWQAATTLGVVPLLPSDDFNDQLTVSGETVVGIDYAGNGPTGSLIRVSTDLMIERCALPPNLELGYAVLSPPGTTWLLVGTDRAREYTNVLRIPPTWCG